MKRISLFKPYMSWRARWYALRVLMGDMIGEGPVVKQFEQEFAAKFNLPNALALNSGTSALELAYHLAGIKKGDEVITTILSCVATGIPLFHLGAKIVFADIGVDLNISVQDVKRKITKKTKAIVFVHLGGNNRGLKELLKIAKEKKIILIEDAAQAVGSHFWGKADFVTVSFQATKTLTTVDGGMLICKNSADYERAKKLRWYGYNRDLKHKNGDTDIFEAGYKKHMNDVTAAIGIGNLFSLNKAIKHRQKLAKIYEQYGIICHSWLAVGMLDTSSVWPFRMRMAFEGVEVGQHHFRNNQYTIFKKFKTSVPNMDKMEDKYIFLPYHTGVTEKQAHRIGKLYQQFR